MRPSDAQFIPTIKDLMEKLSEHIKEEEADDLPKLEAALSQEDSQDYAKSFGRTKMCVPSHSHPSAPDKPPFETVVGLLTAPIDHLADLFRKWPDTFGMPNPSTKWDFIYGIFNSSRDFSQTSFVCEINYSSNILWIRRGALRCPLDSQSFCKPRDGDIQVWGMVLAGSLTMC